MTMTLERYSGIGYDYLVLDTNQNEARLNRNQITKILNRSLGMGADGLIVGPIYIDGKAVAKAYGENGEETVIDPVAKSVFAKYMSDAGYNTEDYKDQLNEKINTDLFISGTIKLYDKFMK